MYTANEPTPKALYFPQFNDWYFHFILIANKHTLIVPFPSGDKTVLIKEQFPEWVKSIERSILTEGQTAKVAKSNRILFWNGRGVWVIKRSDFFKKLFLIIYMHYDCYCSKIQTFLSILHVKHFVKSTKLILLLELHVVLISLITLNIFVIENSFIEKGK